jgi:hypothetical protein
MAFWELNPEMLGSLWLTASATRRGRGIISGEGLHDWGRRAVPLSNYTLAFAIQLKKSTESLVRVAEWLETTRYADLVPFWATATAGLPSISWPRLPGGDFSQPSVGTGAFQVAGLRGSLHQVTFESKLSVGTWKWCAKNWIPRSSWVCLLPTYEGAPAFECLYFYMHTDLVT